MTLQDSNEWRRADLKEQSALASALPLSWPFKRRGEAGQVFHYRIYDDLNACEAEWRAFQSTAIAQPFQSINWLKNWWQAFQESDQASSLSPRIIFVDQAEDLKLILPLAIERRWGTSRLIWLGHHLSDYNAPLIDKEFFATLNARNTKQIWQNVLMECPDVDLLYLPKQPELLAGLKNPFYRTDAYDFGLGYHAANIGADWQAYYQRRRGAKSRRRLKDKARSLAEQGTLQFRELTMPDDRAEMILQTIQWKRDQVRGTGAIDPFADAETGRFFDKLARDAQMTESLRVFTLDLNGESLASAFGLTDKSSFILYQTAYGLSKYTRFSPGTLLLMDMMERMAEEGRELFDFSIGDEPYKFEWADQHSELMVSIRANSLRGWFAKQAMIGKLRLKRWVKSSESRFNRIKAMRQRLKNLTGS